MLVPARLQPTWKVTYGDVEAYSLADRTVDDPTRGLLQKRSVGRVVCRQAAVQVVSLKLVILPLAELL